MHVLQPHNHHLMPCRQRWDIAICDIAQYRYRDMIISYDSIPSASAAICVSCVLVCILSQNIAIIAINFVVRGPK